MNYDKMNLKQLRKIATDYKIPGRADLKKLELIELIKKFDFKESKKLDEQLSKKPKKLPDVVLAEIQILAYLKRSDMTLAQLLSVISLPNYTVNKALSNLRTKKKIDFVIVQSRRKKFEPGKLIMSKPNKVRRYHLLNAKVKNGKL